MISKRIHMEQAKKSNFAELADYITNDQGKQERVADVRVTNCQNQDLEWAKREILAVQMQNMRVKSDKTYHLLISFAPGEVPPLDVLHQIEDRLCASIGYAEHQRISAVHNDTDCLHIHVAINKIHPTRLTIHEPHRDYQIRDAMCAKLEKEFGLQRIERKGRGGKTGSEAKADDMEKIAGVESMLGWIKRGCMPQMQAAQSWSEMHAVMAANGLHMRIQANGLIVQNDEGITVKASSIARDLSKPKLEARLGAFVPAKGHDAAATANTDQAQKPEAVDRVPDAPAQSPVAPNDRAPEQVREEVSAESQSDRPVLDSAPHAGKLIAHGAAPYKWQEKASPSYFVTYSDDNGRERTVWGVDLARAIAEFDPVDGESIGLVNTGYREVEVSIPVLDEKGQDTGQTRTEMVRRNEWVVGVRGQPAKDDPAALARAAKEAEALAARRAHGEAIIENPELVVAELTRTQSVFGKSELERYLRRNTADAEQLIQVREAVLSSPDLIGLIGEDRGSPRDGRIIGRLLAHGAAKFEHNKDGSPSYFVKYEDADGQEQTVWGVDIKRAMHALDPAIGDRISLTNDGRQPITISAPVRDERGRILRWEQKEAYRNVWTAEQAPLNATGQLFTSREVREIEERLIERTERMAAHVGAAVSDRSRAAAADARAFNEGQRKAFNAMTSGDQIVIVNGAAGTGKSYSLAGMREAFEADGYKVYGAILQGKTADDLQRDSGIESRTIHRMLFDLDHGNLELDSKSVLVVDEAGMVGSRQMEALLAHVEQSGAKIRLVGDAKQLHAVEYGNAFEHISRRVEVHALTDIRRQQHEWMIAASMAASNHDIDSSVRAYAEHEVIHQAATQNEAKTQLVERWNRERLTAEPGRSRLVLVATNDERDELNVMMREKMRDSGHLRDEGEVHGVNGKIALATGDQIMFLQNEYVELDVRNGTSAVVEKVNGDIVTARLPDGRAVDVDTQQYSHIDYGYALTIHKSQGVTVDSAHALLSRNMTAELYYVLSTRHKDSLEMFYSQEQFKDLDAVIRRVSTPARKEFSAEYEALVELPNPPVAKVGTKPPPFRRGQLGSLSQLDQMQLANGAMPVSEEISAGSETVSDTQKPPVAKVGTNPPPSRRGRLGSLSQLDQMQIANPRRYAHRPMKSRVDTTELFAAYWDEQKGLYAKRKQEWDIARATKNERIEAAKRAGRLKRAATKLLGESAVQKRLIYSLTSKALLNEIKTINAEYMAERQRIFEKYQRLAWTDWLQRAASAGNAEALDALRAREQRANRRNGVRATGERIDANAPILKPDTITKHGTVIYRLGASAIRDDGSEIKLSQGAKDDALVAALRMAMERYGSRITVNGTAEFKAQIVRVAAQSNLSLTFDAPDLEQRRLVLLRSSTSISTEKKHDGSSVGRRNRSSVGSERARSILASARLGTQYLASGRAATAARQSGAAESAGAGVRAARPQESAARQSARGRTAKPNVAGLGRKPPPQSQNRLRNLSELGVVRLKRGSEVLLPRDVSGRVEHGTTQRHDQLRRDVDRAGRGLTAADSAVLKYIAEREEKRAKGFDIKKHKRYNRYGTGDFLYSGTRQVDGQRLALLTRAEEVEVLPVDESTATRLKHLKLGDPVSVTADGAIKSASPRKRGRTR
ncbi:AAA family ATPase [Burkholderia gladioli]|uniref:TraI/MobA(P) family conjugative relaxase n=1 Tax=Burkholderia gladioli TaxID=28095 RepID=UPI0028669A03|nr:TraI/MobA(P) family conjugative relaxase [Burkholderia gladioli]MDR8093139.1 AAA family ATPase [Burkholderia gladioli]